MPARGMYFEDFEARVGAAPIHSRGATLTDAEIIAFAQRFDPQPFHVDKLAAEESIFGGLAASGFHTLSATFRLACDLGIYDGTNLGSGGGTDLKWLAPVMAGDTIYLRLQVLEAKRSRSKPDRGNVMLNYETVNQRGETVMTITFHQIVKCRETSSPVAGAI